MFSRFVAVLLLACVGVSFGQTDANAQLLSGLVGGILGGVTSVVSNTVGSVTTLLNTGTLNTYLYSPPPNLAAVPPAVCGPGSSPETGLQGEVPLADRESGRSQQGYSCNMKLIGQYQGAGASWVDPFSGSCAYMAAAFPSGLLGNAPGTSVVDLSNPAQPTLSTVLKSTAMQTGPWESLKVNTTRNLLAAVSAGPVLGAAFFDVYDVSNCAHPVLLNGILGSTTTFPANVIGHEGSWAPDGNTYYASGLVGGLITAIDTSNPAQPRIVFEGTTGLTNHGFSLSPDGNRLYIGTIAPAGIEIFDTSGIQSRNPIPLLKFVSSISWTDGLATQATIPVTYSGHPYLIVFDEGGGGGVRFIDLANETAPKIVTQLKLAIQLPAALAQNNADVQGNGLFGYDSHYCATDTDTNPTALACGWFQSGIRVFDIRNPLAPKEIAYFNPPAQVGKIPQLTNSEHASGLLGHLPAALDVTQGNLPQLSGIVGQVLNGTNPTMTADWCTSPPQFVGSQLRVTCQDNGVLTLGFTNGAYPLN